MAPTFQDPRCEAIKPTSSVLKADGNGHYPFEVEAFLVPHEPLRLMVQRARLALKFYNPDSCPWKTERIRTWFNEYFVPILHDHHDNEEEIFFPFYKKLGATDFEKQGADHVTLMSNLDNVVKAINTDKTGDDVREKFKIFADHLLEHLAEEETYWPSVIKRYGEANYNKAVGKILAQGRKHGGQAFALFTIEIVNAMGCSLRGAHPTHGWGNDECKKVFRAKLPAIVRHLIAPSWERKCKHYQDILVSITSDTDTLGQKPKQSKKIRL